MYKLAYVTGNQYITNKKETTATAVSFLKKEEVMKRKFMKSFISRRSHLFLSDKQIIQMKCVYLVFFV